MSPLTLGRARAPIKGRSKSLSERRIAATRPRRAAPRTGEGVAGGAAPDDFGSG